MTFDGLIRPQGFDKIAPPLANSGNASGLQGAHVIGQAEWNRNIAPIVDKLKIAGQPDLTPGGLFNGLLLPESKQGSAALAVATRHLFEAISETNPLDTRYAGDRGIVGHAARAEDGRSAANDNHSINRDAA
jgi:hypothetical protein